MIIEMIMDTMLENNDGVLQLIGETDMSDKRQDRTRRFRSYTDPESAVITPNDLTALRKPYNDVDLVADAMQAFAAELLPAGGKKNYRSPRRQLLRPRDHPEEHVEVKDVHGKFRAVGEADGGTKSPEKETASVVGAKSRPRRKLKSVNYKEN